MTPLPEQPAADPSRTHKWVLLISSFVTFAGLVTAALRENVLAPWRLHQGRYAAILQAKVTDDVSKRAADAFRVELRQVALPGLRTVDRCVTCHAGVDDPRMKDQPEPYRTHPGDHLKHHPVAQFGCTSCHRGQGAAVTFEDAKAQTVSWHLPMLPKRLTESSCGACHNPESLAGKGADRLALGARLFREQGCRSCHALEALGGSLGPVLDREGVKTTHELPLARLRGEHTIWNWHDQHLRDPGGVVANSKMPTPQLTGPEREAVILYLLSLQARDLPRAVTPKDRVLQLARRIEPPPADGKQVYREFCRSCHGDGGFTRWDKKLARFIPAIRGADLLRTADDEYLLESLREGRPGTEMPAWHERAGGLSRQQQKAVVQYLREGLPGAAPPPTAAPAQRGDRTSGGQLFARQCAGCHGPGGRGGIAPSLASPAFLKLASDAFIATTIARGRTDTPMPAFRDPAAPILQNAEIADLIAYLRSLAPAPSPGAAQAPR